MQGDELLEAGFAFETVEFAVERGFQQAKLRAAGIDAGRYGDLADPTFLGHGALKAMHESGISLLGQVHMTQRFRLHRAVRLDEPLTVAGRGDAHRGGAARAAGLVPVQLPGPRGQGGLPDGTLRSAARPGAQAGPRRRRDRPETKRKASSKSPNTG